jgi:hypothetical protein
VSSPSFTNRKAPEKEEKAIPASPSKFSSLFHPNRSHLSQNSILTQLRNPE